MQVQGPYTEDKGEVMKELKNIYLELLKKNT